MQNSLKFTDLSLPPLLSEKLSAAGFEEAKPIQAQSLPILMEGSDLIACAQTGSGKTLAFAIPMISRLINDRDSKALILVPTRELAVQISEVLKQISPPGKGLGLAVLIGGVSMHKQLQALRGFPRILVATPGRLVDHLKQGSVKIDRCNYLVLDEGDRMLDMGFEPQLRVILKYLPTERQTCFFTATLESQVQKLAEQYLKSPKSVMVGPRSMPVKTITQKTLNVTVMNKNDVLLDELNSREGSVLIFTRTKSRTDRLCRYLEEYGYKVSRLHGGRSQAQRLAAIKDLRDGRIRILVATDVAARGLDVPDIRHVINYDLPMSDEDYVHRIGRTGRNGEDGEALSLLTSEDFNDWVRIAKKYQIPGFEDLRADRSMPARRPQGQGNSRKPQRSSRGENSRFGGGERRDSRGGGRRNADGFESRDRGPKASSNRTRSENRSRQFDDAGPSIREVRLGLKPKKRSWGSESSSRSPRQADGDRRKDASRRGPAKRSGEGRSYGERDGSSSRSGRGSENRGNWGSSPARSGARKGRFASDRRSEY